MTINPPKIKIPVIAGPTASGKTRLAVEIALKCGGEVISADSMQIYRGMDIGTAKPSPEEMRGIPHHMIDIADPTEKFSVARYKSMAEACIAEILSRGNLPVIAGGTGQYVNALVYNIEFAPSDPDPKLREALQKEANENGSESLHQRLAEVDPTAAARLHPNDVKRVIRALEIYQTENLTITDRDKLSRLVPPKYDYAIIGLDVERSLLYERIDVRVDRMIADGFLDEVRKLVATGCTPDLISMQGLGYKEFIRFLNDGESLAEAVARIKQDTRRYAKRQLTWFRKLEGLRWIRIDRDTDFDTIVTEADSALALPCKIS